MATTTHSWVCPSCGRRVPLRVDRCHCGATRAQAEQRSAVPTPRPLPPRGAGLRAQLGATMPRDVRALVAAAVVVAVAGLGWLVFGPRRPDTTPRVLGHVDGGPPPAPRPTPTPWPPFKLPWWK